MTHTMPAAILVADTIQRALATLPSSELRWKISGRISPSLLRRVLEEDDLPPGEVADLSAYFGVDAVELMNVPFLVDHGWKGECVMTKVDEV